MIEVSGLNAKIIAPQISTLLACGIWVMGIYSPASLGPPFSQKVRQVETRWAIARVARLSFCLRLGLVMISKATIRGTFHLPRESR